MRAWKRLRTSSDGDADVMLCLEYVDEISARDIARELVGTEDLSDEDDSDIWAHRVNGAKYARVRGRRTMSLGGTVHEKMTVARDDFPRSVRRTMEAVSRDRDASVDAESRARERVRTHGWNHGARGRSAVSRLRGDFIARRVSRDDVRAETTRGRRYRRARVDDRAGVELVVIVRGISSAPIALGVHGRGVSSVRTRHRARRRRRREISRRRRVAQSRGLARKRRHSAENRSSRLTDDASSGKPHAVAVFSHRKMMRIQF